MLDAKQSFQKLNQLVTREGISYYRLRQELGYSSSFFSEWKRGKSKPKIEKIMPLARRFNVPIDFFYYDGYFEEGG